MKLSKFLFEAAIDLWLKKNKELTEKEQNLAKEYFKDLQSKHTEHLDPSAKNLVVLSFQTLELLYLSIQKARNKNLLPATTQWLTKQIMDGKVTSLKNAEEDYIPPLKIYQNNKENLPKLNTVSDIKDLNDVLNENLQSEQREVVPESDLGKIAEMGGWAMYMPHTTEASCELGKTGGKRDTTWCTTRTEGENLYITYVAPKENNYTLFYVIKPGVNAKAQPFAKMSIGTVGDKFLFDQGDDNVTVNANNENLTEEKFRQVLGDETADYFLDKIKEIIGQPSFKHPLISEMERLARDPVFLAKKLSQYGKKSIDLEAKEEFIKQLMDYDIKNPEIFKILITESTPEIHSKLSEDENLLPEILAILAKDKRWDVRIIAARNPNTPTEVLESITKDENRYVRGGLIYNPNITPEILAILANDKEDYVRGTLAANKKTPPEILAILAKDKSDSVRYSLTQNSNIPPEILAILAKDENHYVRGGLIYNPNITPEIVKKIRAGLGLKESRKPKKISLSSIIFRN